MCDPISATIGAAVLGAGVSLYQGNKASKQQAAAQKSNEESAARQAQRAEQQYNKANQKMPDVAAILSDVRGKSGGGMGGTFLTGQSGVSNLPLGGPSLLGIG